MLSRRLLREKVVKQVYACLQSECKDMAQAEIELRAAVDKAYDLYFHMLDFLPLITQYARQRIDIGLAKQLPTYEDLHPNRAFAESRIIAEIESCEAIRQFCRRRKIAWNDTEDLVRTVYTALLEKEYYKEFMNSKASLEDERNLLANLCMDLLANCEMLDTMLEEQSSFWADDLGFILTLVANTTERIRPGKGVNLLPEFKGENEEDMVYARELFKTSMSSYEDNRALIDKVSSNWDIERVALMDIIILNVAICELTSCPDIPVKVTMNEFIEIAKCYSTPSSGTFVNGVLDKVADIMKNDGRIQKNGMGLIEKSARNKNN